jgi:hypothetical protein
VYRSGEKYDVPDPYPEIKEQPLMSVIQYIQEEKEENSCGYPEIDNNLEYLHDHRSFFTETGIF